MYKMLKSSVILAIYLLLSCDSEFNVNIPDDAYTIPTEILNYNNKRNIHFEYRFSESARNVIDNGLIESNNFYFTNVKWIHYLEEHKVITSNCDIYISYTNKDYIVNIFIKKFQNEYRSFYYKSAKYVQPESFMNITSNLDSRLINGIFGSDFNVKKSEDDSITVDFSYDMKSLVFFKNINFTKL